MSGKVDGFDNTDWQQATPEERLRSYFAGDPASDYIGFPEVRRSIVLEEDVVDGVNMDPFPIGVDGRNRDILLAQDLVRNRPEREIRANLKHLGVKAVEGAAAA